MRVEPFGKLPDYRSAAAAKTAKPISKAARREQISLRRAARAEILHNPPDGPESGVR